MKSCIPIFNCLQAFGGDFAKICKFFLAKSVFFSSFFNVLTDGFKYSFCFLLVHTFPFLITFCWKAWALLIQKAILQLLDINPEVDEVELEVENKVLKVKKAEK